MIEVFKTNVSDPDEADVLQDVLGTVLTDCRINFDLQDCDRILRIAGNIICPDTVVDIVKSKGYFCEVLD
jgi:hypothetical protein